MPAHTVSQPQYQNFMVIEEMTLRPEVIAISYPKLSQHGGAQSMEFHASI